MRLSVLMSVHSSSLTSAQQWIKPADAVLNTQQVSDKAGIASELEGCLDGWARRAVDMKSDCFFLPLLREKYMNITETLTRKQISFNSRFEQGKSYTSCMWTTLDSGLKDGIASGPQTLLGLAAKHVSVTDISGGRSMPYSTTFMAHFLRSGYH